MTELPGTRLRHLRQAKDLTLREVAWKVGIHFTTLSKIENGHERPGEGLLVELGMIYEADLEELLALAGRVPPELLEQAATDLEFALLLRALPRLSPDVLKDVYNAAGIV